MLISISSSAICLAVEITNSLICSAVSPVFAIFMIFSNPQPKFTAVGLVANRIFLASSKSDNNSSFVIALLCKAANPNPNAPETPIAGAPLTIKVLIAFAT